jgi:hypothetical protein
MDRCNLEPCDGLHQDFPGCNNCYAERFSERWRGVTGHPFEHGFDLILRTERLLHPLKWKRPRTIFVNSMSDLFHKDVPTTFVDKVFETMEAADWHVFQILTKRSSLLREYVNARYRVRPFPWHIWLGVSVEDGARKSRIRHLRDANASIRFLSIEPLCRCDRFSRRLVGHSRRQVGPSNGSASYATSASRPKFRSSSSNGVDCDQKAEVALSTESSGTSTLQGMDRNYIPLTSPPLSRAWDRDPYAGRRQTEAKHFILKRYLQTLAFKILQGRIETLTFIDGFSGP